MNKSLIALIVVDCLRYDIFNKIYGGLIESQFLKLRKYDSLIFFRKCLSGGTCTWSSMPVLISGFPAKLLDYSTVKGRPTLPQFFKALGYKTIAHVANPVICENVGYNKGFDTFIKEYNVNSSRSIKVLRGAQNNVPILIQRLGVSFAATMLLKLRGMWHDCRTVLSNSLNSIRKLDHENIFLYIHLMDLHFPFPYDFPTSVAYNFCKIYNYGSSSVISKIRRRYFKAARNTLLEILEFLKIIYEEFNFNKVFILITSDHGELLGEHGLLGHDGMTVRVSSKIYASKPLFARNLIEVPLIVTGYGELTEKIVNYFLNERFFQYSDILSHYDVIRSIVKNINIQRKAAANLRSTMVNTLNIINKQDFRVCETDKLVIWGIGLRGGDYMFILKNGKVVTPYEKNRQIYRRLSSHWKLTKSILWNKLRRINHIFDELSDS